MTAMSEARGDRAMSAVYGKIAVTVILVVLVLVGGWRQASERPGLASPCEPLVEGKADAIHARLPADVTVGPMGGGELHAGRPVAITVVPGLQLLRNEASVPVGWRVDTAEARISGLGYAGTIDLEVIADLDGKARRVRIVRHEETPSFIRGMDEPWFLDQFVGRSASDRLEPFVDIDGITHATVSVQALCEGVRQALRLVAANRGRGVAARTPSGADTPGSSLFVASGASPQYGSADGPLGFEPSGRPTGAPTEAADHRGDDAVMVLTGPGAIAGSRHARSVAMMGVVLAVLLGRRRLPPLLVAAVVAALLGWMGPQFVSLGHLSLLARSPGQWAAVPLATLLPPAIGLGLTVAMPRGYCRLMCPLGRLQDVLSVVGRRWWRSAAAASVSAPPEDAPGAVGPCVYGTCERLPRAMLWSGLLAAIVAPGFPLERLEAFQPVFILVGGWFGGMAAGAAVLGPLLVPRFYCTHLCPLGVLFSDCESALARWRPGGTVSDERGDDGERRNGPGPAAGRDSGGIGEPEVPPASPPGNA